MQLWFTSDTHFDQYTIIEYGKRPFRNLQEMHECLIERWNAYVKPNDHIYHLGDVSMKRPKYVKHILDRLQGHKRLVRGNHDIHKTKEYLEFFDEIYGVRVIDNLLFTHFPVHPSNLGRFSANVHGHIHQNPSPEPVTRYKWVNGVEDKTRPYITPYINICVEATDYRPISLEELRKKIENTKED